MSYHELIGLNLKVEDLENRYEKVYNLKEGKEVLQELNNLYTKREELLKEMGLNEKEEFLKLYDNSIKMLSLLEGFEYKQTKSISFWKRMKEKAELGLEKYK